MNYNFFANKSDKLKILEFIFKEMDLQVYDLSSPLGQEICKYTTLEEMASKFNFEHGSVYSNTFQLWAPRHKGEPIFRRIELDPKYCNGHTFRYSTEGWGLIQLYFGGIQKNELNHSHIGHFSIKGASKREDIKNEKGRVDMWNWQEIETTSRKLKYFIHNKLAVRKIGSLGVLPGADLLEKQQGIKLR